MTDGVLLSKDELQELVDIRLAIDTFFKMLAANTDTSNGNEAAAVLQPIARWLSDFVDRVYERAGSENPGRAQPN